MRLAHVHCELHTCEMMWEHDELLRVLLRVMMTF